jgi:hypothetical protein
MMTFARLLVVPLLVLALSVGSSVSAAAAASGYSLFGGATLVDGNNSPTGVQLISSPAVPFSGINFDIAAGSMTFAQLLTLSTDYDFTDNSCGGGSPRFQLNILGKNAFVYIGPPPNYIGCAPGWTNTGNLVGGLIDTSQLPGGGPYDTWTAAVTKYGSDAVTGIQLVADGGWFFPAPADGTQTVVVDNVQINSTTYAFESAASCKAGGWQSFLSAPGPFRNQGDCVSYFATAGKNAPNP